MTLRTAPGLVLFVAAAVVWAAVIGAFAPLEVPLAASFVVATATAWFGWIVVRNDARPVRIAILLPAVALSLVCLVNLGISAEPDVFAVNLALAPLAAALVASLGATTGSRIRVVDVLVALLAVLSLLSLRLWATGTASTVAVAGSATDRYFPASFGHPNQYAAALVCLLPFALARTVLDAGWRRRWAAAALVLGLAALYLTYSRGFWLGFLVSCAVVLTTRRSRLVALAVLGGAVALFGPQIADRVFSSDTFDNSRVEIWGRALEVIAGHPVLGVGVGDFGRFAGEVVLPGTADAPPHAHNFLLITVSETGLLGAAALVTVLLVVAVALVRSRATTRATSDRVARTGCMGALLGLAVGGVFDGVVYHNVQTLMVAAAVVGLAAAISYPGPPPTAAPTPPPEEAERRPLDPTELLRVRIAQARNGA